MKTASRLFEGCLAAFAELSFSWFFSKPNPQGVVVISLGDLIELAGHPGVEDGLASSADFGSTVMAKESLSMGDGASLQRRVRLEQFLLDSRPQDLLQHF